MNEGDKPKYSQETIQDLAFWRGRLEEAKRKGRIVEAVGIGFDWEYLDRVHKEIIDNVIPKGSKIVEVGCGIGRSSLLFDPSNYTGFDFVPEFIELAIRDYPGYKFEVADLMKELPYEDQEFDWAVVISVKGVINGENWVTAEKNIRRIAKHVLVLTYTDPAFWWEAWNSDGTEFPIHKYEFPT